MNFQQQQQLARKNAIENEVLVFVEKYEPILKQSAAKGYGGYSIDLEDEEKSTIYKNKMFLNCLEDWLQGCSVGIKTETFQNIFFKNIQHTTEKLVISWGNKND